VDAALAIGVAIITATGTAAGRAGLAAARPGLVVVDQERGGGVMFSDRLSSGVDRFHERDTKVERYLDSTESVVIRGGRFFDGDESKRTHGDSGLY
jgi:hypothetical protein